MSTSSGGLNAESYAAAFGATVAFGVASFLVRFVPEVELLLILTVLLAALLYALVELMRWYAKHNDGVIDVFEHVCIAMPLFFYTVLFFTAVQYAIRIASDALDAFPLPIPEDFLLLLAVILVLAFAVFPFILNLTGHNATSNDTDTKTKKKTKDPAAATTYDKKPSHMGKTLFI